MNERDNESDENGHTGNGYGSQKSLEPAVSPKNEHLPCPQCAITFRTAPDSRAP